MRPRLTKEEIEFVLELLGEKKTLVDASLKETVKLQEQTRYELARLERDLELSSEENDDLSDDPRQAKQQRLKSLEEEAERAKEELRVLDGFEVRFLDLVNGKKRGRLKLVSDMARDSLRTSPRSDLVPDQRRAAVILEPTAVLVPSEKNEISNESKPEKTTLGPEVKE